MSERKKTSKKKEREILYNATHKLFCPNCEHKSVKNLTIEHMPEIPMLVKTKCPKCGYEGLLVEVNVMKRDNDE